MKPVRRLRHHACLRASCQCERRDHQRNLHGHQCRWTVRKIAGGRVEVNRGHTCSCSVPVPACRNVGNARQRCQRRQRGL